MVRFRGEEKPRRGVHTGEEEGVLEVEKGGKVKGRSDSGLVLYFTPPPSARL